jgi:hypothetical protein
VETVAEITGTSMSSARTAGAGNAGVTREQDSVLQRFAQQWSQLPRDTRQELLEPVLAEAKNNNVVFVHGIMSQMGMLVSMMHPVTYLANMVGKVIKNQAEILGQLEAIKQRLRAIEILLDEQTLIKARTAIVLLNDAANIDDKSLIGQKLDRADGIFTELTVLDPTRTTQGSSGTVPNRALIALGYWGRHLILGIHNQTRYALVQVYECTQKYPLEGMMVFPPEYFSKDYKAEIDSARLREEAARTQQSSAQKANTQSQIDRGLEIAEGVGMIGVGLVGLLFGNGTGIQMGVQAIRKGTETTNSGMNMPVNWYDVLTPRLTAESMKQTRERLVNEVTKECEARLQLLRSIGVGDLRRIIVAPVNI